MAVTSKRDRDDRALAQALHNPSLRNEWLAMLDAKKKADPYHEPIGVDPEWESVGVGLCDLNAPIPREDVEAGMLEDFTAAYGNPRANVPSAQRAALRDAQYWGESKRIAVLVEHQGVTRKAIVEGTPAEIAQALPDADTLAAWKALGVTEVPAWSLVPDAPIRERMTWVPIDKAPVLKRMESVERAASV